MKIGFFITARLKSTRLKQKILLDLNGKPIIERVIERCIGTAGIDGVVLCTSTNPQDSLLYQYACKNNIQFYSGSESDVLDRLLNAAEYYYYDAFLSITADNPLFSIYTSQLAVDWYKEEGCDFIFTKGLPVGIGSYLLDTKALKIACHIKKEIDTEIWGPIINRPDFFKIGNIEIINSPYNEDLRLTCDYPEDYRLIREIYKNFCANHIPSTFEIFDVLTKNSNLWSINSMHNQSQLDNIKKMEINNEFTAGIPKANEFAQQLHKKLTPGQLIRKVEI